MHTPIHRALHSLALVAALTVLLIVCGGCGGTPETDPTEPGATATPLSPTAEPTEKAVAATPAPPTQTPPVDKAEVVPTDTPTPTPAPEGAVGEPAENAPTGCAGLQGELEVQLLVGPAEAVGMEPVAVGRVPFAVTADSAPYLLEGSAPIDYEASEAHDWGSYTVVLSMDLAVFGACSGVSGNETLDLVLEMAGEQNTTVAVDGMTWEYPWSGSHTLDLSLPLIEGASGGGEGWSVVLHLAGD